MRRGPGGGRGGGSGYAKAASLSEGDAAFVRIRLCATGLAEGAPQAQEPVAFGLSIVKPCFSMVSTKSMEAPPRYGALMRSVTTLTPPKSLTTSPSRERSSKKSW